MFSHYKIYKSTKGGYYSFKTKNDVIYRCFFTRSITSNNLHGLDLESSVYLFAFSKKGEQKNISFDPAIGRTIAEILNRFFNKRPTAVIAYICDNMDDKAKRRQLSFENWFIKHNVEPKKSLIKADLANIIHAGAIVLSDNPDKILIQDYFNNQLKEFLNTDKSGSVETIE